MSLPTKYNTLQKLADAFAEFTEHFSFESGIANEMDISWTDEDTAADTLTVFQVVNTDTGHKMQMAVDQDTNDFAHRGYNANSEEWSEWVLHGSEGASTSTTYCILNYNANYSTISGSVSNLPSFELLVVGSEYTISTAEPSCSGYLFTGWNTASDGSGTSYSAGDTITISSESTITLYAQWELNTFTVTFYNKDNTVNSTQTVISGECVTSLPTAKSVTGYSFNYWYYDDNGANVEFTTETLVTSDMSIYGSYSTVYVSIKVYYPVASSASATSISWSSATTSVQEGTTWGELSLSSGYKNKYSGWTMSTTYYTSSTLSTSYSSSTAIASGDAMYLKYTYSKSYVPAYYYVLSRNALTATDTGNTESTSGIVFGTAWSSIISSSWASNFPSIDDYSLEPTLFTDASCTNSISTSTTLLFTDKNAYDILYGSFYTTYTATFVVNTPYLPATTYKYNGTTYTVDEYEMSEDCVEYTGDTELSGSSISYITLPDVPTTVNDWFYCGGWRSSYDNIVYSAGAQVTLYDNTEFTPSWEGNYLDGGDPIMYNIGAGTDVSEDSLYASSSDYLEYPMVYSDTTADGIIVIENPLDYLVDQFKNDTTWNPEGLPGWQTSLASTYNPYDGNIKYSDGDYAEIDISETKAYYVATLLQMVHDYILGHMYYSTWQNWFSLYPYWDVAIIYSLEDRSDTLIKSGTSYTVVDPLTIVSGSAKNTTVRYGNSFTIPMVDIEYEHRYVDAATIEQFSEGSINDSVVENLHLSSSTYTIDSVTYPLRIRFSTSYNQYTITWVDYNGNTYATTNVLYAHAIEIPDETIPEETGVEFNGTYLYDDGSEFVTGDTCDGDITIYPQYDITTDTYTLKIYYYDTSSSAFKSFTTSNVTSGTTISSTSAYTSFSSVYNTMTSSYDYGGMYTASTYSSAYAYNTGSLSSFGSGTITKDLTVYALFTYPVDFYYTANGGYRSTFLTTYDVPLGRTYYSQIGSASSIKSTISTSLPSGSFNWSYMYSGTLSGNIDKSSPSEISGTKITSSTICKGDSISSITALYIPSYTRTITLNSSNLTSLEGSVAYTDSDGETLSTATTYAVSGYQGWYYSIPTATDTTGVYTLKGWYTTSTGSTAVSTVTVSGLTCMEIPSSNKTYYSQWSSSKTVTLKIYYYNSSGTQTYKSASVTCGTTVSAASIYSTVKALSFSVSSGDAYTFEGVYSSNAYSGSELSSKIITSATNVYAKFQREVTIYYTHNYGYTTPAYSDTVQGYTMLGKTVYASLNAVSGLFSAIKSEVDSDLSSYGCSGSYSSIYNSFSWNTPGTSIANTTCTSSNYFNTIYLMYLPGKTATINLYTTQLKEEFDEIPYYWNDSNQVVDSGTSPYTITSYLSYHVLIPKITASIDGEDAASYTFTQWYSDEDLTEEYDDSNNTWGTNNEARYIDITGSIDVYSGWEEARNYSITASIAGGQSRYVKDAICGSNSYPTVTISSNHIITDVNMKNAYQWEDENFGMSIETESTCIAMAEDLRQKLYSGSGDSSLTETVRKHQVTILTNFQLKSGDVIKIGGFVYTLPDTDDPFAVVTTSSDAIAYSGISYKNIAGSGSSITYSASIAIAASSSSSSVSSDWSSIGTYTPTEYKITSTSAYGASYSESGTTEGTTLSSGEFTVSDTHDGMYLMLRMTFYLTSSSNSIIPITNDGAYVIVDESVGNESASGTFSIHPIQCTGECQFDVSTIKVNGNTLKFG